MEYKEKVIKRIHEEIISQIEKRGEDSFAVGELYLQLAMEEIQTESFSDAEKSLKKVEKIFHTVGEDLVDKES